MFFVLAPNAAPASPMSSMPSKDDLARFQMLQIAIEGLADGLMVITPQGEVVEANLRARQICHHLNQQAGASNLTAQPASKGAPCLRLPAAIWQTCQQLIEQNELCSGHSRVPEFELTLDQSVTLRIRLRWIDVVGNTALSSSPQDCPYLLITIEERNSSTSDIRKYGLSEREMQVWKLRLQGYTYQDIANKLYITVNTVKKHTKNILAKQRLLSDSTFESGFESSFETPDLEELISV